MKRVLPARAVRGCDPVSTKVMAAPNEVLVIITPRRIPTALKEKLKETITHMQSNHKINALGQYFVVT